MAFASHGFVFNSFRVAEAQNKQTSSTDNYLLQNLSAAIQKYF